MATLSIIADDLTGAADCGIAFAAAGLPTFVALSERAALPAAARVVAIDTDSRWLPPNVARDKVEMAARRALAGGASSLYKKIDSTLRGNVAVEIAAVARIAAGTLPRPPLAIVAPAFPALGRTTRDGRVQVDGIPLELTEIWAQASMSGPADLPGMLTGAGLKAVSASLALVRSGKADLAQALQQWAGDDTAAVVCDAENEDDLRHIATAGAHLSVPVLWAGSAGLARHLPAVLDLGPTEPPPVAAGGRTRPVLCAVGSLSALARQQLWTLASVPSVACLTLAPEMLLRGKTSAAWRTSAESAAALLADGRDLVVTIGGESEAVRSQSLDLAAALGRFVAEQAGGFAGLIVTGGDTARAVLGALGADGMWLLREVEPGVPLGIAETRPPLTVITKAGAFGHPDTLRRCRQALNQADSGTTPRRHAANDAADGSLVPQRS